jgi:hypothetical protein
VMLRKQCFDTFRARVQTTCREWSLIREISGERGHFYDKMFNTVTDFWPCVLFERVC